MNLQHLKVFHEVALAGSLSAASKRMRITQPAISRTIQSLEGALGFKLFVRKPRGISLTAEGAQTFERCRVIFKECQAITEKLPTRINRTRIAASENLCLHVFPQIFAETEIQHAYPELFIELTSGTATEVVKAVLNGTSDVGYCYHSYKGPGIVCEEVGDVFFEVLVGQKFAKTHTDLKQLKSLAFIGSKSRDYASPYAAKAMLTKIGLPQVREVYQSNSQEAQAAMAVAGLGFTLLPRFIARPRLEAKRLFKIPTKTPLKTQLYRISQEGHKSTHLQEDLEKYLVSALKN